MLLHMRGILLFAQRRVKHHTDGIGRAVSRQRIAQVPPEDIRSAVDGRDGFICFDHGRKGKDEILHGTDSFQDSSGGSVPSSLCLRNCWGVKPV